VPQGKIGLKHLIIHFSLIDRHLKHRLGCVHLGWSMERLVTYL
jgi:hypothetical protein